MNLDEILAQGANDPFWAMRGRAIETFAELEQSLCSLFATLTGMEIDIASFVFFKLGNFQLVRVILSSLLTKRHGDAYKRFWKSVDNRLDSLNGMRNKIVHWNIVHCIDDNGLKELRLHDPNIWDHEAQHTMLSLLQIEDFAKRCFFFGRLCNMFKVFIDPLLSGELDEETKRTWHDICQQEVTYPPPSSHPLSLMSVEPESQPPPSPASPPP
jgi:hypothetical protein